MDYSFLFTYGDTLPKQLRTDLKKRNSISFVCFHKQGRQFHTVIQSEIEESHQILATELKLDVLRTEKKLIIYCSVY